MKIVYNQFGDIRHIEMDIPDKRVVCWKCSNCYNLRDGKMVIPESGRIKEPACPKCNCKLYYS